MRHNNLARHLKGLLVYKSKYYRNRYECVFYGRRGTLIKEWIREQFGEDDMIYASDDNAEEFYESLISEQQLTLVILRWA